MKTQLEFCSACDRDVLIAYPEPSDYVDGQANIPDPHLVCLDIGERCTGSMCPVAAQPPDVMARRLVRSGMGVAPRPD
jgi:hypothetical protein